jgi:short subunit dehydrogenase-like uncharacterized protein
MFRWVPFLGEDPLVLANPHKRFDPDMKETKNRMAKAEWLNLLPHFESILMMGVSAPFLMAICNAKIVYASAIALNYGKKFVYRERYLATGFIYTTKWKLLSIIPALLVEIIAILGFIIVKIPFVGTKLVELLAPPGSGPPDHLCRAGKAEIYSQVTTAEDILGKIHRANCSLKFKGDPGNFITAQCLCESAIALLFNRAELPTRSEDGFGTPAELLGNILLKRLTQSKVRPVEMNTNVRMNADKQEWLTYR